MCTPPFASVAVVTQSSPLQQSASAVQTCEVAPQTLAATQTPFVQASAESQQGVVAEQAEAVAAHEGVVVAALQAPLVAPCGMSQPRPVQQSPVVVQVPFTPRHAVPHLPASQVPVQHSPLNVHAAPSVLHVPGVPPAWHRHPSSTPYVQAPSQQLVSLAPPHSSPVGVQADAEEQRSTPLESGTHGAPPQHWSLNWQIWSVAMQQSGFDAS
jgi:hypothetical protein